MKTSTVQTDSNAADRESLIERGWAALPASYRIPKVVPTLSEARAWCQRLTESHYENFHVASWFLPKPLRAHFHCIYAYCRIADDLGDEVNDAAQSLALLDLWGRELDACYEGRARHPVFVALADTIRVCSIPKEPFSDLLVAFRQDQTVNRFESIQDLLAYCRYSAHPVGRMVLYVCGEQSEENFRLADLTCSGLQLANSWQDVSQDISRNRVYLPQEDMRRFGVTDRTIIDGVATPEFRALMRYEVDYARSLFEQGLPLMDLVGPDLALDLDLFSRGGLEILSAIEQQDYDVLQARPVIGRQAKLALGLRAFSKKLLPFNRLGSRSRGKAA